MNVFLHGEYKRYEYVNPGEASISRRRIIKFAIRIQLQTEATFYFWPRGTRKGNVSTFTDSRQTYRTTCTTIVTGIITVDNRSVIKKISGKLWRNSTAGCTRLVEQPNLGNCSLVANVGDWRCIDTRDVHGIIYTYVFIVSTTNFTLIPTPVVALQLFILVSSIKFLQNFIDYFLYNWLSYGYD